MAQPNALQACMVAYVLQPKGLLRGGSLSTSWVQAASQQAAAKGAVPKERALWDIMQSTYIHMRVVETVLDETRFSA